MNNLITILDVLDNFFDSQKEKDILKISGTELYNLGEEVRKFSNAYQLPPVDEYQNPIYLGGWPSANFWHALNSELIMTCLLYSGQILVKDPISDWFSDEQYYLTQFISSRKGYYDVVKKVINNIETRAFLKNIIPALNLLRPLIENGIIVLVPSMKFSYKIKDIIKSSCVDISNNIITNPEQFTLKFKPSDITVDDNKKGLFVFSGGNKEIQIQKQVLNSINYFLSEFYLSSYNKFCYTAAFPYESYLCSQGIDNLIKNKLNNEGGKVVKALLETNFPIYSGLTPNLILTLKNDPDYLRFREELVYLYRDLPTNCSKKEINDFIKDREGNHLIPILDKIKQSVNTGILMKIGLKLAKSIFSSMSSVIISKYINDPSTLMSADIVKNFLLNIFPNYDDTPKSNRVWTKLYKHNRNYYDELFNVATVENNFEIKSKSFWGIKDQASLSVLVTEGRIIIDTIPNFLTKDYKSKNPPDDVYDLCPCGSGLKYRFCCQEIKDIKPRILLH